MQPHGERLHNPFNLEKAGNIPWQGLVKISFDPVFCEFQSDLFGLRAGFVDLKNQLKEGFNTIEKLITKFAPPTTPTNPHENNTEAYIEAVVSRTGIEKTQTLQERNLKALGVAIIIEEQGRNIYSDVLINTALELAGVTEHETVVADNSNSGVVDRMCKFVMSKFS